MKESPGNIDHFHIIVGSKAIRIWKFGKLLKNPDLIKTIYWKDVMEFDEKVWEEELGKESERRLIAEEYVQSNNLSIVSNELLKDLRNDGQKAARYETAIFLAILLLLLCAVVIVGLLT